MPPRGRWVFCAIPAMAGIACACASSPEPLPAIALDHAWIATSIEEHCRVA